MNGSPEMPMKEPLVNMVLVRLESIEMAFQSLESQLAHILTTDQDEQVAPTSAKEMAGRSNLALTLTEVCGRLESLSARMTNLSKRIDL